MQNFMTQLILNSAIMSTISVILIALTPLLRKRYTAESIYYTWIIIVGGFIIPFRPHMVLGGFTEKLAVNITYQNLFQRFSPDTGSITGKSINFNTADNHLCGIVLGIWIVGILAIGCYFIFRHYRFVKLVNRWSRSINDHEIIASFDKVKDEMKIKSNLGVRVCPVVSGPMLMGLIKPVIILPDINILPEAMPLILKHELAHYKRKHLIAKGLALIAVMINWFNPVTYFVYRHLSLQMELTCDKSVVSNGEKKLCKDYSEAILHIVSHQTKREGILSTNFLGGNRFLQVRLLDIMNVSKKKFGAFILSMVIMVTIMSGIVAAEASDKQQLHNDLSDFKNIYSNIYEDTYKIEGDTLYYFKVFDSYEDVQSLENKELSINYNGISVYVIRNSFITQKIDNKKIVAKYIGKIENQKNREDKK